jgi:WD40 repeat protein
MKNMIKISLFYVMLATNLVVHASTNSITMAKDFLLNNTLYGHKSSIRSVVYSPDGLTLASGSEDNTIKIWNTKTGTYIKTLEGHKDRVLSVAYSPNGNTIASGSGDTRACPINKLEQISR